MVKIIPFVLCCFALVSCSSSSTTVTPGAVDGDAQTGLFLDSAVEGISYKTETLSGITNENGQFQFVDGENVTFKIGDLSFPVVSAVKTVTPLDMTESRSIYDNVVVNVTVLLQSLDVDADPSNGIEISDQAAANAAAIDLNATPSEFAQNPDVLNLVANSGSSNTSLISTEDASNHFQMTLVGIGELQSFTKLEYTNLMIGSTADFAAGSKIYYRADGVKFSKRLNGEEYQGTWSLDSNGLICEEIRGGESTYCIADSENYLMTKSPDSDSYNFSETGFVSSVTITLGDTLGLSGS